MILPRSATRASSPSAAEGRSPTPTIGCWRCGRPRARSTCCPSSKRSARGPTAPPGDRTARAWMRGEVRMSQARAAGGHAMAAARDLSGAARHAAYAAGRRPWSRTSPRTSLAPRPTRSRRRAPPPLAARERAGRHECRWQRDQLPMRFANSSWTISGCATRSAGRYSTADGRQAGE